jgi:RimJ/RimL family protein N-acetyltransferase
MAKHNESLHPGDVILRDVIDDDLPLFFEHQLDQEANFMAAFTVDNPADQEAFLAHWSRIRNDPTIRMKTIVFKGRVVGYVSRYYEDGRSEITYWIDRADWGKGIASMALWLFLKELPERPVYARAAKDNRGSLRVLEKAGFVIIGEDKGFASARGEDVEEYLLRLGDR